MAHRLTYGGVLAAIFWAFSSTLCYAPTDPIVNAIDYANGLVKDASSIQEEYANYANTYVQGKIGELGDVNAIKKKTDKAKKLKDQYNKAQEKYSKAKALADKAKEKKEALTQKANELKAKAEDMKKKYDDAMKKVNDIKDKVEDVKDKVEDVKDKVEDVKDKVEEGKAAFENAKESAAALKESAAGTIDAAQDKVSGAIDTAKEKAGMSAETETDVDGEALPDEAAAVSEGNTEVTEDNIQKDLSEATQTTPLPTASASDRALTAIQALTSNQEGVVTNIALPTTTTSPQMISTISADEVLELSETQDSEIVQAPEATSDFNLEEQLLMSDELKAKERKENAAPQLTVEALKKELKAGDEAKLKALRESRRQSFGLPSAKAVEENANEK